MLFELDPCEFGQNCDVWEAIAVEVGYSGVEHGRPLLRRSDRFYVLEAGGRRAAKSEVKQIGCRVENEDVRNSILVEVGKQGTSRRS